MDRKNPARRNEVTSTNTGQLHTFDGNHDVVDENSGLLGLITVNLSFPLQVIDDVQVAHRPGMPGTIRPGTEHGPHPITRGNIPN